MLSIYNLVVPDLIEGEGFNARSVAFPSKLGRAGVNSCRRRHRGLPQEGGAGPESVG